MFRQFFDSVSVHIQVVLFPANLFSILLLFFQIFCCNSSTVADRNMTEDTFGAA